jgi:hypothetical protein
MVMRKRLSMALASQTFGIPVGTIFNKIHKQHTNSVGAPTVLSKDEELALLENALIAANYGNPLNSMDIRFYANHTWIKSIKYYRISRKISLERTGHILY